MQFTKGLAYLLVVAPLCAALSLLGSAAQAAPTTFTFTVSLFDSVNGLTGNAILTGSDLDNDGTISGSGISPIGNEWESATFTLYDNGTLLFSFTDVAAGVVLNPDFSAQATPGTPTIFASQGQSGNPSIFYGYDNDLISGFYFNTPATSAFDQATVTVPEPGVLIFGVVSALTLGGLIARRRAA